MPFNPAIKDGRGTTGLTVAKTNWANVLDTPPYEAYAITCGVTFTFGGVKIDPANGQVEDTAGKPMPGLVSPPANWSAAFSITTMRAAPASYRARCSANSPAIAQARRPKRERWGARKNFRQPPRGLII